MKTTLRLLLLLCALTPDVHAQSAAPPQVNDVPQRLRSVGHLINDSSIAQQIGGSGNEAAKRAHAEARRIYDAAVAAEAAGDHAGAVRALGDATHAMVEAGRMVDPSADIVAKHQRDYQDRLDSVATLTAALDRINTEKSTPAAETQPLRDLINSRTSTAAALAHDGEYKAARATLDEAYVAAKVAIEHLRGGATLVRSLNFANKQEEYAYELDRNDTHRMLVQVLAKEKMQNRRALEDAVADFMHRADIMRADAERQAKGGDFDAAVKTLENSTAEIVRAIRSAGVYIPG